MATSADPLRRTLDAQAVAPDAAGDRPYLEAMLKRLGYSDAEIAAYIGTRGNVPPAGALDDAAAVRDIELEYTGPGLRPFRLVVGVDASELPATGDMEAGTEVFDAGPSMEEVDALVASGDFSDFDDWGEGKPQEDAAGAASASEADALNESPETAPDDAGQAPATNKGPEEFQLGEGMVAFQETALNEATVEPVDPKVEAAQLAKQGWDVADLETGEFAPEPEPAALEEVEPEPAWEDPEPAAEAEPAPEAMEFDEQSWDAPEGYAHNDWKLYSRDELRGDTPQRIYFFSRDEPAGGAPADVPDGYEVAENPETGRPFLRRAQEESTEPVAIDSVGGGSDPGGPQAGGKKRVRILRVRAASREDAAKKMAAEGRNVLASMPIDIEKRLGEDGQ